MKFNLDTEKMNISLSFNEDATGDELIDVVQDFCFGMASFFIDFAMKLNYTSEDVADLKDVCISCINRNIDVMVEKGVLDDEEEDYDEDNDLDELIDKMNESGFSADEIDNIIRRMGK